jgi:serine/threonine-protein kinase
MSELIAFDLPLSPAPDGGYTQGEVLADRYELTRVIGHGGTAVVWVARDSVLDIDVAAKIVLPSRDDLSSGLRDRTIQEARLCAQLTEPAICRVLDFGFTRRGDPFVVSELLKGETLDDRLIRESRLGPIEAVRLLLPLLDALGAAHKKGIVHRDVKPANVFLTSSDGRTQPKLLDFGIACSRDVRSRMTLDGTICGTPCYMSPEQARGMSDIDRRSDLWSFCVMLYETVTGTAPFLNDDCNVTLLAIANQAAPSLATFGCDAVLARIVERGMQKHRDARWPSAAELANALAHWLAEQGVESDVSGISLRRRFLDRGAAAVPVQRDVLEDLPSERPSFIPGLRPKWAGAIALFSTLAAVVAVVTVVVSVRPRPFSGVNEPRAAAVAPVVRPPPGPPLPISEDVRTGVTAPAPARKQTAPDAAREPPPDSVTVGAARARSTARRVPEPVLPDPPWFMSDSPFSSRPRPPAADGDVSRAKLPARPPARTRGTPRRDYGI